MDVFDTAQYCDDWPGLGTKFKHQRHLQLFPLGGTIEYIAIDIIGSLLRTKYGNQFVVTITDR